MEVIFKKATEDDFKQTEELTREAFWDLYKPGCDEHLILHKIRKRECYLNELDIVAREFERIIGHIICTKAMVIDSLGIKHEVLCVGPFSILPELQRKGYGSKLMEHCIKRAGELGYSGMILFGNPFGVEISSSHTINIVTITLLIYVWFILTTKLDLAWNIAIIILLAIYFLFESKYTVDLGIQLKDQLTTNETKSELVKTFVSANNIVLVGIFGVTLIGTLFYTSEKQVQYGGGFNLVNFWFE